MTLFRRERASTAAPMLTAAEDARRLVLELAGRLPAESVDAMQVGVVLEPQEDAVRAISVSVRSLEGGLWSAPEPCLAVVSDRRVLVRRTHGALVSMWWSTVAGVEVDLTSERVVLDFGDGCPCGLFGPQVAVVGVMAVACLYGVEGLVRHPGLESLRGPVAFRQP